MKSIIEVFRGQQHIRNSTIYSCKASFIVVLAIAMGVMFSGNRLLGQVAGYGTISGTVQDSSGAVVPNATVTATNVATGLKSTQTTSAAGTYTLPALPPGEYTIDVNASGFAPFVQEHVVLNALTQLGVNVTLKVGATQRVVVTAATPELQTQNGSVDTTIPQSTYTALPIEMNGGPKSPVAFVTLVPGAGPNYSSVASYSFNGGAGNTGNLYIDGLPLQNSSLQSDNRTLAGISTEVVNQFQVITSGVPAYYDGQGIVNLVLKSGTNSFHGQVFENIRNTAFDAAGYFSPKTPVEHQNEFGFTVGGPILHNRLFFFGSYDGYRITSGTTPTFYTIPTTAERTGDFSALPPIYDPNSTVCAGGVCTRTQFSYNGTANVIPPNRISPVSQSLQSYLPAPQNNQLQNNIATQFVNGSQDNMFMAKVDGTLWHKNQWTLLFDRGDTASIGLSGLGGLPLPYSAGRLYDTLYYNGQVHDTHTFTPNLVNVFGFYLYHQIVTSQVATLSGDYPSKAGLTGLPAGAPSTAFPPVTFTGPNAPTGWGATGGGSSQPYVEVPSFELYQDNVQWVHGRHSFTFGGQAMWQQDNLALPSYLDHFGFVNTETAGFLPGTGTLNTSTGNAYASYLLGTVDNANASVTTLTDEGARYQNYAVWAQDDWKATPKLTINLGLRYTIPKPFTEAQNRASWLNPTQPNPAVDGYPGALQFAGSGPDSCHCKTNIKTHYLTFGPRVGFAYAATDQSVIRGSYSIVHFNGAGLGGGGLSFGTGNLGYSSSPSFTSPDSGITPAFNWNNGFPAFQQPPFFDPTLGTGFNTTTGPQGGGYGYNRPDTAGRSPYSEEWNLTFEQQLPASMVMQLTYAGSSSHFLAVGGGSGIYSDQLDPKYQVLGGLLQQPATAANIALVQQTFPNAKLPYANFDGSIGQMLRPFPQYSGAGAYFEGPDPWATPANASYNSFQTSLSKRMSQGLYFLVSYTWSRQLDESGATVNFILPPARSAYNIKAERSVSTSDIPNSISIAYVYSLPFGRDRRFDPKNSIVNAIIGGWQLSGLQQYASGTPVGTIAASAACNVPYSGTCYADYNPAFNGNARINGKIGSHDPRTTPYFDVNAFKTPANYTFGDTPRTLAYSTLRNAWSLNEDFALAKEFKLFKQTTFRFQADAFNAFNRTWFYGLGTDITASNFGYVSYQANTPRQLQFEGYIRF